MPAAQSLGLSNRARRRELPQHTAPYSAWACIAHYRQQGLGLSLVREAIDRKLKGRQP